MEDTLDRNSHHGEVIRRSVPHLVEINPMILVCHNVAHVTHSLPFNVWVRLTKPRDFAQLDRCFADEDQVVLDPYLLHGVRGKLLLVSNDFLFDAFYCPEDILEPFLGGSHARFIT
jgi:hypothetical protein